MPCFRLHIAASHTVIAFSSLSPRLAQDTYPVSVIIQWVKEECEDHAIALWNSRQFGRQG